MVVSVQSDDNISEVTSFQLCRILFYVNAVMWIQRLDHLVVQIQSRPAVPVHSGMQILSPLPEEDESWTEDGVFSCFF